AWRPCRRGTSRAGPPLCYRAMGSGRGQPLRAVAAGQLVVRGDVRGAPRSPGSSPLLLRARPDPVLRARTDSASGDRRWAGFLAITAVLRCILRILVIGPPGA